ncbi:MAG: outer membrane beta-barrel family protein [Niabella sp.]
MKKDSMKTRTNNLVPEAWPTYLIKLMLFVAAGLANPHLLFSQTYRGYVLDSALRPLQYANIVPAAAEGGGTVSDERGFFELFIGSDKKTDSITVSRISYTPKTVATKAGIVDTIILIADQNTLREVVVSSQRNAPIRLEKGALVVDVQTSVLGKENKTFDVLRKIPGMMVKDGKIVAFSGEEPVIYIDNRKALDMTEVNNIAVKNIKSIKLLTNPGALYDASGKEVLIIYTKKLQQGLSVQLDGGMKANHLFSDDASLKLNYNSGKWNIFGSAAYEMDQRRYQQDFYIKNTAQDLWEYVLDITARKSATQSLSYNTGFNLDLGKGNAVGVKYSGTRNRYDAKTTTHANVTLNGDSESQITALSNILDKPLSDHVNVFYNGKLAPKITFSAYADYYKRKTSHDEKVREDDLADGVSDITSYGISSSELYAAKGVLKYALADNQTLSAGGEGNFIKGDGGLTFSNDDIFNSLYKNTENKQAAFLSYELQKGKVGLDVGLRQEFVKAENRDILKPENDVARHYDNLFPSFSLAVSGDKLSQTISYKAGAKRPPFQWLTTNSAYVNHFQRQIGNPALRPQTFHRVQYMLVYKFIYFSTSYTYNKDYLGIFVSEDPVQKEIVVSSWKNYDHEQSIEIVSNFKKRFKVYEPDLTLAFQQHFLKVKYLGNDVNMNRPILYIDLNNYLHLGKYLLNGEYIYSSGGSSQIFNFRHTHEVGLSLQRSFYNDRLSLALKANDVFKGNITRLTSNIGNIYLSQRDWQDQRYVSLHMTWRFNNYRNRYKGQSASQADINRL